MKWNPFKSLTGKSEKTFDKVNSLITEKIQKTGETKTKTFIESGKIKFTQKNYQGAIHDFSEAIKSEPQSIEAYFERSKAKRELKDEIGANEDLINAKILDDKMEEAFKAYHEAGEDYDSGNYKNAVKNYNRAISFYPNLTDVYYNRGIAKQLLKDNEGALKDFDEAIERNASNKGDAYYQRGRIKYYSFKDQDGALLDYTEAINLNPNDSNLYSSRAILLDDHDAINDLSKAIELNPAAAILYLERGLRKKNNEDFKGSLFDVKKFIDLAPSDKNKMVADAHSLISSMKVEMGDFNGAIEEMNKVVELIPTNPDMLFERGMVRSLMANEEAAILDFSKAIEINPKEPTYYYYRGLSKKKLGLLIEGLTDAFEANALGYSIREEDFPSDWIEKTMNLAEGNLNVLDNESLKLQEENQKLKRNIHDFINRAGQK